jgi:nickel/cobalt transporter (NicO) family protein
VNKFLKPISLCLLIGLLLALPMRAAAHALDEYLQAIYITLTPKRVTLEMDLTPALLVAPQVLAQLDANHDEQISEAEGTAFANAFLKDVVVVVDDQPLSVTLSASQFPAWLNLSSGVGTIRLDGVVDVPISTASHHTLVVQNRHQPVKSAYLVNVLLPNKDEIRITQQDRNEAQHGLQVSYDVVGVAGGNAAAANPINTATTNSPAQQLVGYLSLPTLTPALMVLALGLAIALGGLHALTPGHGKTLVAAYLVGSRGTVQHAVFLGSIVTFTHTVSVIAVGLLALLARQVISPNVLVPVLEIGSGLLVLGMGVQLVLARWRALRTGDANAHDHGFGAHTHDSGNPDHAHLSRSGLLAMGVSGGLVPCPEALGIMLVAIGLNRIALGLGLIVAFSAGLAIVLILIGVVLVRSKSLADRLGGVNARWQRGLPLVAAVMVTLLGAGIVIKGVLATVL